MKINTERKNGLLHRREMKLIESYNLNPGKAQVLKNISEHFKIDEDMVVINRIESHFGTSNFVIDAFVYDDIKFKKALEMRKVPRKDRRKK